ncbi:MAG TPA: tetratricopeptide repeat protein [Mycobacteriales bacterium]|nr:tetratricopeptide repeat protein [Mycobacteriales bacterium]
MALYFPRANALLLLTPKTGSTWIREKVRRDGLDAEYVGDPAMRDHDLLGHYERDRYRFVGAFVRDPIEWYRSYWAYRMERGWRPGYELDRHCQSGDFQTFVRRAVTILPGALGNIYASYIGAPGHQIDFVGRQERLAEDFDRFLRLIGEDARPGEPDADVLVNRTRTRPDYPEDLKELITLSEWDTMERLGYLSARPDPVGLAEIRARYPDAAGDLRLLALWTEKVHWQPDDQKRAAGRPVPAATRHARVHTNFALFAQHKRHDLDYAETRYRLASELDPRHPRTLCTYAMFRWEHRDDPVGCHQLMCRALAERPGHSYTLGRLARFTDRSMGDPESAEALYRQSLAGNADQHDVRVELANLLARRDRADEAIALLRPHAHGPGSDRLTTLAYTSLLLRADPDGPEARRLADRLATDAPTAAPTGAG